MFNNIIANIDPTSDESNALWATQRLLGGGDAFNQYNIATGTYVPESPEQNSRIYDDAISEVLNQSIYIERLDEIARREASAAFSRDRISELSDELDPNSDEYNMDLLSRRIAADNTVIDSLMAGTYSPMNEGQIESLEDRSRDSHRGAGELFDRRLGRDVVAGSSRLFDMPYSKSSVASVVKTYMANYVKGISDEAHNRRVQMNDTMLADSNMYGTSSVMNPYSVIRLYGSLDVSNGTLVENRMIDKRYKKKFYDINSTLPGDVTSVSTPTTTNIIKYGNGDPWSRVPYSFQDFVFSKHWNIIPNNRMITLRRYTAPTYDNLHFPNMVDESGSPADTFSPISTAVTYFGEGTGNNISDILSFTTGLRWSDIKSEVWNVTASGGTNTGAINFGNMIGGAGASVTSHLSTLFFNLLGIGEKGTLDGQLSDLNAHALFKGDLPDPYDNGPLSNRIEGPINVIDSVKARSRGLDFSMPIELTFEYKARPIGGVNTKAIMLDILANMLMMGSAQGTFFKGGHRFNSNPNVTPVPKRAERFLNAIYSNDWTELKDIITEMANSLVGGFNAAAVGAKNIVSSTVDAFRGDEFSLDNFVNASSGTQHAVAVDIVKTALSAILSNRSIVPYLQGMRALLLGDPVGEWHITIGNPLNPAAMIGNLIMTNMKVEFGEELGPDDFPLDMKFVMSLEHAMGRDRDAIASMFNRGAGRIYELPDWVRTSSDSMTNVDKYTSKPSPFGKSSSAPVRDADGNIIDSKETIGGVTFDKIPGLDMIDYESTRNKQHMDMYSTTLANSATTSVLNVPKYTPSPFGTTIDFRVAPLEWRTVHDLTGNYEKANR